MPAGEWDSAPAAAFGKGFRNKSPRFLTPPKARLELAEVKTNRRWVRKKGKRSLSRGSFI